MRTLTKTEDLAEFCREAARHDYVTLDTEFLRERTYYSKLCLVQMAIAGDGEAVLVDPLAEGLDLAPLYDLFRDTSVVKVFHAARQDLEIFFVEAGVFPEPLFDTQVLANRWATRRLSNASRKAPSTKAPALPTGPGGRCRMRRKPMRWPM